MISAAYCVAGGLVGRRARRALPSSNFPEAFHRSGGLREKSEAWHAPFEVLGALEFGRPGRLQGQGRRQRPVQVQGPGQAPRRLAGAGVRVWGRVG